MDRNYQHKRNNILSFIDEVESHAEHEDDEQ
jgi:hypothetical protein